MTFNPQDLLKVISKLVSELHPDTPPPPVTLDSSLDRDLGLDSLARMELLSRLENTFFIRLPEQVLASAETPRDLLRHIETPARQTRQQTGETPLSSEHESIDDEQVLSGAATLNEVLHRHASTHPDRTHILLDGHDDEPVCLTYAQLSVGASRVAAGLQQYNLEPGETVAIILPTSTDYFFTFLGVLLAGGIPVPLYPPVRPTQIEEHLRRHKGILQNARVRILITIPEVKAVARLLKAQVESMNKVTTVAELFELENQFTPMPVQPRDIAFLQYTSGSTGDPKGVVLTHANLLANIRAMGQATEVTSSDIFVSWLPLYHDMGLIGAWLGSMYHGCQLVIMPPLSFIARPERWLWAIHKHRGTLSASPNFGYELCFRRISDNAIKDLDLSSWRLAFNGAEPVTPEAIANFSNRFADYGFRKSAMAPVYGLAESSVGLAFPPPGREPVVDRIERDTFTRQGHALPATKTDTTALEFVACGHPLPGHQIRIVDNAGHELPERQEGFLQFKGPSVTSGYFRSPEKTKELFDDDWLESGDLAYTAGRDVYITGRIKDIIIRGGRNIYPHELEEAVGNIEGIRKGCTAVFGSNDPVSGTERLIVLAESRKRNPDALEQIRMKIVNLAVDLVGMPPDDVVIAPPGTVLKTSSGKIRRAASRELYEEDRVGKPKRAVWLQVTRMVVAGLIPQTRRVMRLVADTLYAGYCWALFGLLSPPVWLLVVVLPGKTMRWLVTRYSARLLALLSGTRLTVQGREHIALDSPVIIASNHMSYLDGFILQAALPIHCSFVAKGELASNRFVRLPLKKIGAVMVERFDMERGLEDARQISDMAARGQTFLFFPEGTFQRMPGLLPFRMGAFLTAVQAGIPTVPVTIRGTRNKMRSDSWFPRRGPVDVIISKPIQPEGNDWPAAVKLREAVRSEILTHLGEPNLAGSHIVLSQVNAGEND